MLQWDNQYWVHLIGASFYLSELFGSSHWGIGIPAVVPLHDCKLWQLEHMSGKLSIPSMLFIIGYLWDWLLLKKFQILCYLSIYSQVASLIKMLLNALMIIKRTMDQMVYSANVRVNNASCYGMIHHCIVISWMLLWEIATRRLSSFFINFPSQIMKKSFRCWNFFQVFVSPVLVQVAPDAKLHPADVTFKCLEFFVNKLDVQPTDDTWFSLQKLWKGFEPLT